MADVATQAGVSRATVSLALRDHPRIPAATRARVVAVAEAIGYRRHPLLSALMATRRRPQQQADITVLAYLSNRGREEALGGFAVYRQMRAGVARRAEELGYVIEDFSSCAAGMTPSRLARILHHRGIRGILVAPLPGHEVDLDFPLEGFAAVGLGLSVHRPSIPRVASDHFLGAKLAVHACHRLGYRRIGLIVNRQASERLQGRWIGGLLLARYELGTPPEDCLDPFLPSTLRLEAETVHRWARKSRPEVVLLGSYVDDFPYEALPKGTLWASLGVNDPQGGVSGIWGREDRVGEVAVDLLVDALNRNQVGSVAEAPVQTITPTWVEGRTVPPKV